MVLESLEVRHLMCALHELPTWFTPVDDASGPLQPGQAVVSNGDMLPLMPTDGSTPRLSVSAAAPALPGLPELNSLPGAPAAIYLDFNGSGAMLAYSEDTDFTSFNASEQANITGAWRQMSTYFAMFNVNVTTVKPSVPTAWGLLTNSVSGAGYSYVGVFPNSLTGSPQSFNPAGDARTRQSGIAHEIGHNFGLGHQSDYDSLGNKTNEYSSGYDATHGPIMGVDYAQSVHKWFNGHPTNSPSALQDDIAVIAGRIASRPNGGDGFRPDDVGGTSATAGVLPTVGGVRTATGIIERMSDADAWSFTATAGRTAIDVDPVQPSGLIPEIEVYDSAGNLIATKDDADQRGTNNNDVSVAVNTNLGDTYYAVVKSHGDYGDVGQYDVTATDLPAGWGSQYIGSPSAVGGPTANAGYAKYDSATGAFTIAGAGGSSWGTSDQSQLAGTTLTGDGSVTVRVSSITNTNVGARAGIMVRETNAQNARLVALNASPSTGLQFSYRSTAGGSLANSSIASSNFAPTYLRLVRSGNTFTAFRSADGVTFTQVGSAATVSMASAVTVGLFAYSANASASNVATFDNLTTTGGVNATPTLNALAAPTGLTATPGTGTGVTLGWADGAGEIGYAVERSMDGVDFAQIATTAANVVAYNDNGLWGSMRYYYRVRALDAAGRSAPSASAAVVNRPNAPGTFTTSSWQTTRIILNWRDVSGETGFRVERSTDGGTTFTPLATVGVNIPSYTDATVVTGNQYKYRIAATSAAGDSPYSTVGTESPRLLATTGTAFTSVTTAGLAFRWDAVAGSTGYKIYRSTDGATFTALTNVSAATLAYTDGAVSPLGEYYYRVVGTNADTEGMWATPIFAAAPAAAPLPVPWQTQDVGAVPGPGASGWASTNGGTFTVVGSGLDIWGTADQFRYAYTALVGDGSIVARVASQENSGGWAKAGVMVRETLAAGSKQALMLVSPSNGTALQYRASTNGASTNAGQVTGTTRVAPYWVKLIRAGSTITGYTSTDGVTWTLAASATISMTTQVYVGLAVDASVSTLLNKSTFDNVTVSQAPTAVASTKVGDGTVQRSMVNQLTVTLTRPAATVVAGAFVLTRRDDGTTVPVTAALSQDGFTVTLTFAGTGQANGSLADGVYDWTVNPTLIRDQAAQGGAGSMQTTALHRLFADFTGDRAVGFDDFNLLAAQYGKTVTPWTNGDLNGDGAVGFDDFNLLAAKYGTSLPADGASTGATPAPTPTPPPGVTPTPVATPTPTPTSAPTPTPTPTVVPSVATPTLTVGDVRLAEGTGGSPLLTFTVRLSKAAAKAVSVRYATSDGTAKAGGTAQAASDYAAASGTLTFAPGQLVKSVSVSLKADKVKEADETLFLTLSQLTGPATIARAKAVGTIKNDD